MRVASVREISKQEKAGKARVRGDAKAAKPGSKTKLRLVKPAQKGDG